MIGADLDFQPGDGFGFSGVFLADQLEARGDVLEGALNVRTRDPRAFTETEIDLLLAIAAQVAQSIEHAKLYAEAQRRVTELEALARISEAVSESLYLQESLEAIVKTTMDALSATGAALVLEDGEIAWPEGHADAYAVRQPLRWRGRQIGELVADRSSPFSQHDRELLASIAQQAAVALEHGRAVMRGVLAQEIHHRVKNNLQTVASLLRLQASAGGSVDPRKALEDSVSRILAIAAVHELLTERRDDDVDLADLLGRLRSMLVQGLAGSRAVDEQLGIAAHAAPAGIAHRTITHLTTADARLEKPAPVTGTLVHGDDFDFCRRGRFGRGCGVFGFVDFNFSFFGHRRFNAFTKDETTSVTVSLSV